MHGHLNVKYILDSTNVFRKSWLFLDNVEKYRRAGQDTDDNIMWCL